MTHKNTWKQRERQIASYFGTKRVPLSGSNSGHDTSSDSMHPTLYIEDKLRAKFAAVTLWDDTATKAKAEGKTPVVCLAEKGRPGFWVMVHSNDLIQVGMCRQMALEQARKAAVECDKCGGKGTCQGTVMGTVCRGGGE